MTALYLMAFGLAAMPSICGAAAVGAALVKITGPSLSAKDRLPDICLCAAGLASMVFGASLWADVLIDLAATNRRGRP